MLSAKAKAGSRRFNSRGALFISAGLLFAVIAIPLHAGQNQPNPPRYAWAPALLYGIISSPNSAALDDLYDAAFAAGPAIVPDLISALQDDRTAEFAAQSLAFTGGQSALAALARLVDDPRDLALSRFYYGALGEIDTPKANSVLLNAIFSANHQPDRTITEAAILALTVRSDPALIPPLEQALSQLTDPVIQDDLRSAISIIRRRSRYVKRSSFQRENQTATEAARSYFRSGIMAGGAPNSAKFQVEIERIAFSPDKSRALAGVIFKEAGISARYRLVLQEHAGGWTVASVWLRSQGTQSQTSAPAPSGDHSSVYP